MKAVGTATGTTKCVVEPFAAFADPTDTTSGDSGHEGEIGDIVGDNCPSGYEGRTPNSVATNDGAVGPKGGTSANECLGIGPMNREMGSRCGDIGEDTTGATEDIVFDFNAFVYRDVILDTHPVADMHVVADVDILAEGARGAYAGTTLNVAEVPHFGVLANNDIVVDIATFVDEGGRHGFYMVFFIPCKQRERLSVQ